MAPTAAKLTGRARLTTALTRTRNSAASGPHGTRARLAALGAALKTGELSAPEDGPVSWTAPRRSPAAR
ncbi:hypothetical protein [Streptomyces sp. NPDC101455]|uniref:hypothetical protein n=1 Tax=Streptomyces sp. NPDC101455 TaxID=3366142 RepID=UPI003829A088